MQNTPRKSEYATKKALNMNMDEHEVFLSGKHPAHIVCL